MNLIKRLLSGKTRKTAGVPVTPAVHAMICRANLARDIRDWPSAAAFFRKALAADPSLIHIWVQLGHMLKEAGEANAAADAYLEAFRLDPADLSCLGWLYGVAGRLSAARRPALIREIFEIQGRRLKFDVAAQKRLPMPSGQRGVIFDVSDLMAYFGRARRPTGIQRVQIEIIRAALEIDDVVIRICCSVEESINWVEIDSELFRHITSLATAPDDVDPAVWRDALLDLNATLALGEPFHFDKGGVVVNLGTSWWLRNYFLQIRNAKFGSNLEYVPFIHDLIPVLAPQHCVQGLVEDFNSWILSVFDHAQRFLVNSQATKHDLIRVAGMLGRHIADGDVTVVALDGAFPLSKERDASATLARLKLHGKRFILFVSTIESRKGHIVALRAWQRLLAEYGDKTPYLVCVGNDGWLNSQFYDLLKSDAGLRSRVTLLSGLADDDLACLYRSCLFTIYPSTYEGWGLPITEALTFGKVVITADNSSLPEAGGESAIYCRTGDDAQLAKKVARLTFEDAARQAQERKVRETFRPRTWSQIARQIIDAVTTNSGPDQGEPYDVVPPVEANKWLDFRRTSSLLVSPGAGSAERLRFGTGWASPDMHGCWIKESEAELRLQAPISDDGLRLVIKLYANRDLQWSVNVNSMLCDEGCVDQAGVIWSVVDIPGNGGVISIAISGRAHSNQNVEGDVAMLGVRGCMILPNHASSSLDALFATIKGHSEIID